MCILNVDIDLREKNELNKEEGLSQEIERVEP